MADDLQGQLGNLDELGDDQLRDLEAKLLAQLDELGSELSDDNLASMDKLSQSIMSVRETLEAREADQSERQNKAAEIMSRVQKEEAADPATVSEQPVSAGTTAAATAAGETQAEPLATATEAANPESDRPSIATIASRRPGEQAPRTPNPHLSVIAAADVPGYSSGNAFPDIKSIGDAFSKKVHTLVGGSNLQSRYPVAQFQVEYPEDRYLRVMDLNQNTEKVNNVASPDAIVAAGGLCAPVDAHYGLMTVGQADRPVRDALARFAADRGGIRYITPPTLADVGGAIGYVTEADDTAGYPPTTKPILTITCGTEVVVEIAAVTLRLKIGNFSRRTFPEQFEAWHGLALTAHARVAESRLLATISTGSTAVTDGQNLSAWRDLLETYTRLAVQMRSRHRTDESTMMDVLLPFWVPAMVSADMAREHAGDGPEHFNYTKSQVESAFKNRGLNVTWYLDSRTSGTPSQIYAAQPAGTALPWNLTVEGYMYFPGTWMFLDGGTLDLGVEIRDSTLNATNDVEAFMETFEGAAKLGPESLRIRNAVCISGAGSLDVLVDCSSDVGS